MKPVLFGLTGLILVGSLIFADDAPAKKENAPAKDAPSAPPKNLESDKEKFSYSVGFNIGSRVTTQFGKSGVDLAAFVLGVQDALAAKKPLVSREESEPAMARYRKKLAGEEEANRAASAERNKKEGAEFLAKNAKEKGVVSLPSGAQYLVLKEGNGKKPKATDEVEVHYHGTLIDGTVFDSSVNRKESIAFALNGVIPGWTEVVQLMKEGSKWRVFLPPELAYGARGSGATIGPNAVLIFEIELIKIK